MQTLGVISYLLWSASGASFIWFVLARILSGISRANVGVLSAMVSDVSDRETRTRGMAAVGVAYSIAYLVGPPASAWLLGRLFFNPEAGVSVLEPHIGLIAASLAVLDYICLFSFPETASVPDKNRGDAKVKKEVSPSTPTKSALEGIAGWNLLFFELEKCRSLVVNRALGIAVPTGNTSLERLPATFSHTLILSDVIYKFANAWLQYFVLKGLLIINHLICCLNPPECFKSIILAVAETAQSPGTLPFPKHCRQNWYVQMSCNCSFFTTVASGLVMFFQSAPLF